MAISTASTFLMYKTSDGSNYTKVCDITNYPDLGSTPTKIDISDLSIPVGGMKKNILGLQEAPDFVFEAMYSKEDYTKIKALEGEKNSFELQFGVDGVDGKIDWDGTLTVFIVGGGIDEPRKISISISVESQIVVS